LRRCRAWQQGAHEHCRDESSAAGLPGRRRGAPAFHVPSLSWPPIGDGSLITKRERW